MKSILIKFLFPILPQKVLNSVKRQRWEKQFKEWQKNGCPVPPPHIVKQNTIQEYQEKYKYKTLVETGTYLGDMIESQKNRFEEIISVEISVDLHKRAQQRFKKDKNVTILLGDSGEVLPKIMKDLNEPAIFWLDGHYSGGVTEKGDKDCPIFEELDSIFDAKKLNHIFLIDDARHFAGEGDYPTIDRLTEYVKSKNEKYKVEVKNDIIRYVI